MPIHANSSLRRLLCLFVALVACGAVALFAAPAAGAPEGMILVRGGAFLMGNTLADGQDDEKPVHSVTLDSFYMGRHEVTWKLYSRVYAWATNHGYTLSEGICGYGEFKRSKLIKKDPDDPDSPMVTNQNIDSHPVTEITWYDAVKWCNAYSEMEGRTPVYYTGSLHKTVIREGQHLSKPAFVKWDANGYRLPTEAEWEFAAKGGAGIVGRGQQPSLYAGGNAIDAVAWHSANATNQTHPVGLKQANILGLYDMSGNVLEWCYDFSGHYQALKRVNPRGLDKSENRVLRGGSINKYPSDQGVDCRITARYFSLPGSNGTGLFYGGVGFAYGFRVVISASNSQ